MKKIIDGKMYNTESANFIATYESPLLSSDLHYFSESLFLKRTGEFFLYCEGNAGSRYASRSSDGFLCSGSSFVPLSYSAARCWVASHCSTDLFIRYFGIIDPEIYSSEVRI